MRLDALCTPAAFSLTAAGWSREQIEAAIEWLIQLLDEQDDGEAVPSAGIGPDPLLAHAAEMQNPPLPVQGAP